MHSAWVTATSPTVVVTTGSSLADQITAWGTLGVAVAAVAGLIITLVLAHGERRDAVAERAAAEQRLRDQADRRLGLAASQPVAEHTRTGYTAADKAVRVMVSIVPSDAVVLRYVIPT